MNGKECPVCGQEYATRAVIKRGTHWKDLYSGTLFDYLTRYRRRCTAPVDIEVDEDEEPIQLPQNKRAVYFHGDSRLQGSI